MLENTFTRVQVLGELSNPDAQLSSLYVFRDIAIAREERLGKSKIFFIKIIFIFYLQIFYSRL